MTTTARVGVDISARDRTSAAFASATQTIQRFGGVAAAAIKGFAVGFASTTLLRGLKSTVDAMDEMAEAAQRMGVGVDVMSSLAYAAKLNGASFETLQQSAKKLGENLSDIAAGKGGDAGRALSAMGISVKDASGQMKGIEQVIEELAGKFSRYEDGVNKGALATALFGKAGVEMLPMLNAGADAIREATAEAEEFGVMLSGPAAEAAGTFNDNIDRMSGFVQGVSQDVVSAFLPAINELIDKFLATANAAEWADSIIEGVRVTIREITRFVIEATAAWEEMLRWTQAVGEGWDSLKNGDLAGVTDAFGRASADVAKIWKDVGSEVAATAQQVNHLGKGSLPQRGPSLLAPVFARAETEKAKPKREKADKLAQDAKRIFEDTRSPLEAYNARIAELGVLLGKGYISQDTFNRAMRGAQADMVSATEALNTFTTEANSSFDVLANVSDIFQSQFTSAFDSIIDRTMSVKQAFANMAKSILADVGKMFIHQGIKQLFAPDHALYGGGGGVLGGALGRLFSFLPSFDVGADRVPRDMVAKIHKDEMIIPAKGADAIRSGGGVGPHIMFQVNNYSKAEVRERPDGSGFDIVDAVSNVIANGGADRAMRNRYNVTPGRIVR